MSVTEQQPVDTPQTGSGPEQRRRNRRTDLIVAVLALAGALWVTGGAWLSPNHRAVTLNDSDQALFEWLLSYAAHAVTHGTDPLWTTLLNAPDGVNLAVNTAYTVVGVVLTPVTLLLGPPVTFLLVLTVNLAATAYAWYLLFSRAVVRSRAAAALGGLFCGFAPGLISHGNGHLNWTAQYLLPLIVWLVLRLGRPGRPVRRGLVLGVLVAVQYSIGSEMLFFTAIACAILVGGWALAHRTAAKDSWRRFLVSSLVTAGTTGVLLGYPLWMMFLGPQTYHGTGFDQRIHSEDLAAYGAFPHLSLAGLAGLDTTLAPNFTEENSFYGLPLLLLVVIGTVLLLRGARRSGDRDQLVLIRTLLAVAGLFALLSLGPRLKVGDEFTDVPLPYLALSHLPLFDAALPARLALITVPVVGVLLALLAQRYAAEPGRGSRRLVVGALAVALLPVLPVPLPTITRDPVPRFISDGTWRRYVRPGQTLVPVPPTSNVLPDGQRWQAHAFTSGDGQSFAIPAGFFLGPGGPDGTGRIGPVPRPTYTLLEEVAKTGVVPTVGDPQRTQAATDLAFWRARVVVLPDPGRGWHWSPRHDALLATVTALLGPGKRVDDVWLWQVG